MTLHRIAFYLDSQPISIAVAPDITVASLLSLHIGCNEGVCGACTMLVDGEPVRSCLMLAVQIEGAAILTVRSLPDIEQAAEDEDGLTPLQRSLRDHQAFQCGWCVPGLLVGTAHFMAGRTDIARAELLSHLTGHLCRCLASAGVVEALEDVLAKRREERS